MGRFAIQQFRCNGASAYYAGARSIGFTRGKKVDPQGTDGTLFETAHHVTTVEPECEIVSRSLKAMAQLLVSSANAPMLNLDGTNGLTMYLAKGKANAPEFAAGSTHLAYQALRGVLYLASVRWAKGGKAEARIRGLFFSPNGLTASIIPATAALPTLPLPNYGFTLSAIIVAGATITAVDSMEWTCDPKFRHDYTAGLPEPTSVMSAGPNGQIEFAASAEVGDCDLGEGTGATSFVFTSYAHGGGMGTDTLTITMNSAWSIEDTIGGDNGSSAKRRLNIRAIYDGVNIPSVLSVGP